MQQCLCTFPSVFGEDLRVTHAPTSSNPVAIVGATGAVGRELVSILLHSGYDVDAMRLFAGRDATMSIHGRTLSVSSSAMLPWIDGEHVFMCAGSDVARTLTPDAIDAGAIVIDNSSAFRMTDGVPLVVPEVNAFDLDAPSPEPMRTGRVIANPNCSTIILLVALEPLRAAFGIDRVVVSTYQAASGAGIAGMDELRDGTEAWLRETPFEPRVFPEPYAFNLFCHNSPVDAATGRNEEEQKMIDETRKIWHDTSARVSATCVRVPVLRAHSESINVTLRRPTTEHAFREALRAGSGITIIDDREHGRFPTPMIASGNDDVFVGHIRPDESQPTDTVAGERVFQGFDLFACGDQLRKGAALNAFQISETLATSSARNTTPEGTR